MHRALNAQHAVHILWSVAQMGRHLSKRGEEPVIMPPTLMSTLATRVSDGAWMLSPEQAFDVAASLQALGHPHLPALDGLLQAHQQLQQQKQQLLEQQRKGQRQQGQRKQQAAQQGAANGHGRRALHGQQPAWEAQAANGAPAALSSSATKPSQGGARPTLFGRDDSHAAGGDNGGSNGHDDSSLVHANGASAHANGASTPVLHAGANGHAGHHHDAAAAVAVGMASTAGGGGPCGDTAPVYGQHARCCAEQRAGHLGHAGGAGCISCIAGL